MTQGFTGWTVVIGCYADNRKTHSVDFAAGLLGFDSLAGFSAAGFGLSAVLLPLSLGVVEVALSEVLSFLAAGFADPYKSAYQPPPLSRKPVPPEIWRLAVFFLQAGHWVSGASLMG
jgi:hypothetical protein